MAEDIVIRYLERPDLKRFEAVVSALHRYVYAIARRILGDGSLADDVAQEVFTQLLSPRWDPADVTSGKGLVNTLTVQTAQDMRRSRERREHRETEFVLERETSYEDEPALWLEERCAAVQKAISELPEDVRRCVELRYYGELKVGEIATTLRFRLRRVERHLQAGRKQLSQRLTASQGALVLPVLDGRIPPSVPDVSAEHLAELRRTVERRAQEHFEMVAESTEAATPQSAPPQSPADVGNRLRLKSERRTGREAWRRSWWALSASAVVVVVGVGLIAWLLTERPRPLGVVVEEESSTTPLGEDLLAADPQITPVAFTDGREALSPGASTPTAGAVAPPEVKKTPMANEPQFSAKTFLRNFFGGDRVEVAVVDENGNLLPRELLRHARLMVDIKKPGEAEFSTHLNHKLTNEHPCIFFVKPALIGTRAVARLEVPGHPRTRTEFVLTDERRVDFTLPTAGESVVQLLETWSDRPILAAEVVATVNGSPESLIRGITGRDGRLTLRGLVSGAYNDLSVLRSGYPPLKLHDTEFPAERTIYMHRFSEQTCALKVGTPGGSGARVVAIGAGHLVEAETDSRGNAAFEGLVPGFYRFEYRGEGPFPTDPAERAWCATQLKIGGFYNQRTPARPRRPIVWTDDPPPSGSLSFEIVDLKRRPVSGVELLLDGGWRREEGGRSGMGRIDDLEPVRYTVELVGKTHWMLHYSVRIKSDEEESVQLLYGRRTLRGRLVGGVPGEAYQLLLLARGRSSYAQPGPGGQFEFGGLLPGEYRLFVMREDGSWLPQRYVVRVAGEDPDPLEISLSRLVPTWVVMRRAATSTSSTVPEVLARNEAGQMIGLELLLQGTTDYELFGLLPAGEYRFEAQQGFFGSASVEALVAPGNREPIVLPVP